MIAHTLARFRWDVLVLVVVGLALTPAFMREVSAIRWHRTGKGW